MAPRRPLEAPLDAHKTPYHGILLGLQVDTPRLYFGRVWRQSRSGAGLCHMGTTLPKARSGPGYGSGRFFRIHSRWKCVLGAHPDTMKLCHRMARITISRNGPQKLSVPYGWRQAVQRRNNAGMMTVDVSDMEAYAGRRDTRLPVEGACVSRGRAGSAGQTPGPAHPSTWRISLG